MSQVEVKGKTKPGQEEGDFGLDLGNVIIPAQVMRCPGCKRFLGYQAIAWGAVKIKCPNSKCKKWVTFDVSPDK